MTHLSLRLRVFLFFVLLGLGALLLLAGALALGWARAAPPVALSPFVTAFVVFALLNTALLLGVWLLFDENVAKPINRLSADLRMRVHSDVKDQLDTQPARYLGDLAGAAAALTEKAEQSVEATAAEIARETQRLGAERERLTAVLTESPIATLVINPNQEIVLYDAQAALVLSGIATPRLKAPLSDYFQAASVTAALHTEAGAESTKCLSPITGEADVTVRVKALGQDGHMLFFDPADLPADTQAQRPLVFDFDLLSETRAQGINDRPLSDLCYVVLDLETTGLSVEKDDIVQIGAVRVLNGALVAGETVSTYVNPGRPIPPASSRIHHVTDDHVADAPAVAEAVGMLHHFSRDAVLVAHNAPFDIGLLKRQTAATGAEWDHPVLDTVLLSAVVFGTTEVHSLDALCARLDIHIAPEDRHTALGDARATADALVHLLKMVQAQGYDTFGALQPALDREARRLYAPQ